MLQKGMTEDRCFSDAFEFAPHIKSGQAGEIVQTPIQGPWARVPAKMKAPDRNRSGAFSFESQPSLDLRTKEAKNTLTY
jgi:hypothetical protein